MSESPSKLSADGDSRHTLEKQADRELGHWQAGSVDATLSNRIAMARILAVLGLVYTHAPLPDVLMTVTSANHELAWQVRSVVADGIGRSSAALLSVVSGWLIVHSAERATRKLGEGRLAYRKLLRSRLDSLVLPWLSWAVFTVLIFTIGGRYMPAIFAGQDPAAGGVMSLINRVLFVTEVPYGPTMHLAFIRDLFVCVLLYPVLVKLVRLYPIPILLLMAEIYLLDVPLFIIHRPLILFGFVVGIALAVHRADLTRLDRYFPLFLALSVIVLVLMQVVGNTPRFYDPAMVQGLNLHDQVLMPLIRIFSSLTVWTMTAWLVKQQRLSDRLIKLAALAFAIYAGHFLILRVVHASFMSMLFGDALVPNLIFFLLAPVVTIVATLAMMKLAAYFPHALTRLFFGPRAPGWRLPREREDEPRAGGGPSGKSPEQAVLRSADRVSKKVTPDISKTPARTESTEGRRDRADGVLAGSSIRPGDARRALRV